MLSHILEELINNIPDYKTFHTPDELDASTHQLAKEYRDVVRVVEAGKTRSGKTIYAIEIGEGREVNLWFGCPHPNEPVGTLVIEYLTQKLAEDEKLRKELGGKWIFIKAADRDGLELNKGWLKGPYTILNYALNFYRPAGNKQVEWTFPIEYKKLKFNDPLPETKAIMNIIDNYKPSFIYSLHNAGFGGVYFYISHDLPTLYPVFWYYVHITGVPLGLGEPEVPWAKLFGKAVYYMVSTPEHYDFLESLGYENPAEIIKTGTDSYDYARRLNPNVVELVTEVPYYYDPRINDMTGSGHNRRTLILERIDDEMANLNWLIKLYNQVKDKLTLNTRFRESVEYFLETSPKNLEAEKKWAQTDEKVNREATVAEWLDNKYISKFYRMLRLGLVHRMLQAEVEHGNKALKEYDEEVLGVMEELSKELEKGLKYTVIPLKKLVTIQLASGLYTTILLKTIKRGRESIN